MRRGLPDPLVPESTAKCDLLGEIDRDTGPELRSGCASLVYPRIPNSSVCGTLQYQYTEQVRQVFIPRGDDNDHVDDDEFDNKQ